MLPFCSCSEKGSELFVQLSHHQTKINFSNDIPLNDDLNILNYIYYFNGGGVAAGDINNDGFIDLYFSGNQVSSRLYLNEGNLKFRDITATSFTKTTDWASGVTMADVNADGWLDIYVCRAGSPDPEKRSNLLFINRKNNTFEEMAEAYGLADKSYSTDAAFFDYDLDGDLDMYLLNHVHEMHGLNNPKKRKLEGQSKNTDKLYRNNGLKNGHPFFEDVSHKAGVTIEGFGLGLGISDINHDGFADIYVSNDFISNDILYINQGDGSFKNEIAEFIKHQSHNGMGNDIADINNDGLTDVLVMDMLPSTNKKRKTMLNKPNYDLFQYSKYLGYEPQYMRNTLQLNRGNFNDKNYFSEIGQLAGVSSTDWSWASLFADFDLDGYKDIYITNGYLKDITDLDFIVYRKRHSLFTSRQKFDSIYLSSVSRLPEEKQQNYFFKNNKDLTFEDVSKVWTNKSPGFSNGAAYADLDNDGDLDMVVNNINEKATVLKNTTRDKSNAGYLTIDFKGPKGNPNGIGSKVWVHTSGAFQFSENFTTRGFQSSVAPELNFGISDKTSVDSIEILWPDQKYSVFYDVPVDTTLTIEYGGIDPTHHIKKKSQYLFQEIAQQINVEYKHKDMLFVDFKREPLIPRNYSFNGPSIAVADINGDELDDFYISGSFPYFGKFFTQNKDGTFDTIPAAFNKNHEGQASLFFDSDNDGDNDLYLVNGGSELFDDGYYHDKLYINDGNGNFNLSENLPKLDTSGSCVTASDYDKDGDLDLFVGGRIIPGSYGLSPKSHLLKNENGVFKDATISVLGGDKLGMVTSGLWTDFNNDGWKDLIIVGEWMPITIFQNNQGGFFSKIEIKNTHGWWNSINGGDFDNDGDTDYILGNLGKNSVFKASVDYPISLAVGDFDKDQKIDPILSIHYKDDDNEYRSYPFASRDLLLDQLNFIKNKFRTYKQYSTATIGEIVSNTPCKKLSASLLESIYLENLGDGNFKIHPLPNVAQFAPVMGTVVSDFNLDGNLDVLLVGNFYHNEVSYGQSDASLGLYLQGRGDGTFLTIENRQSGFFVDGDARALARLNSLNDQLIIAAQNSDSLKIFRAINTKGKTVQISDESGHAEIIFKNGKKQKIESYLGEGYQSQSSKSHKIPTDASFKTFYN